MAEKRESAATSNPLVSAVVANWNGARHLEISLPSLLAQSYRPLEIIVVDDGSTDDSAEVVSKFDVRWLPLGRNIGFLPALNKGARAATGEFVVFLNNDMRFHGDFVGRMASEILRDPDVFSTDALQHIWDGTKKVHLATRLARENHPNSNCFALVPGLYIYQKDCVTPVPAVMASSANIMVRKTMFDALGGFDEKLPFGYEDVEICWRAWLRGWKTVYVPQAVCWHHVLTTIKASKAGSSLGFRGVLGGRLLFATKLLPARFIPATLLVTLAGLARDLAFLRWQRVRDRVKVFGWYAYNLPALLRERRELYRSQHTSPVQQLERLLRLDSV